MFRGALGIVNILWRHTNNFHFNTEVRPLALSCQCDLRIALIELVDSGWFSLWTPSSLRAPSGVFERVTDSKPPPEASWRIGRKIGSEGIWPSGKYFSEYRSGGLFLWFRTVTKKSARRRFFQFLQGRCPSQIKHHKVRPPQLSLSWDLRWGWIPVPRGLYSQCPTVCA